MCVGGSVHQTHEAEHWEKIISRGSTWKKQGIHRALSNKNIDAGFFSSFFPVILRAFVTAFLQPVPPSRSRCLVSVFLQYSRCYSQTVCTTFFPSRLSSSFKSKLAGNPRGGGASAQGAGPRGRQHDVTARLGL